MSQFQKTNAFRGSVPLPAIFALSAIFAAGIFLVGFDQGHAFSPVQGAEAFDNPFLHELFHDARHAAGLPCH